MGFLSTVSVSVLINIIFVLVIIVVIILVLARLTENRDLLFSARICIMLALAVAATGFIAIAVQDENKHNEIASEASKYITESGYRITVNGEKITQLPDDLTSYDVQYNHDDKIVVLIKK